MDGGGGQICNVIFRIQVRGEDQDQDRGDRCDNMIVRVRADTMPSARVGIPVDPGNVRARASPLE